MGNIVLNCDKLLATVHHINLTALASAQRDTYTGFHTTTTNFSDNTLGYNSIQAGALTLWEGTGSYKSQPTMASVMGKASYDYASRYYLTATLRADGSSKFGDNHKWGYFPSVSASWAVTREPWMQGCASWLANLKLNVGYGWSGNQGGIDNYMSMNIMEPSAVVPVGQEAAVSMASLRNANPDLKWETRKTVNLGLEAALLENRIIATLAYYNSKTCDMLYMYDVSTPPFPYKNLLANLGSMRNRGLELSLGFTPVHTRDLELNINTNWTFQQTKLLSLSGKYGDYDIEGPAFKDIASLNGAGFHGGYNHIVYQIVGQPLGVFYLPHCTGLKSNGKGGYTYEIADLDGDHNIDISNGKDRRVCGQAIPKVLMGTNVSLRYKLLDISLQVNGAFGHKIYNGTALTYMNMNSLPGYNVLAKAPASNIIDQTATDYWLEKGDYVNFDYLTIGINVPLRETARKYVKSLRVALTCNNLATITSYSGLTPMINSSTVGSTLGLDDKNVYPLALEVPSEWLFREDLLPILGRYKTLFLSDMDAFSSHAPKEYGLMDYLLLGSQQIVPAVKLDETGVSHLARCATAVYLDLGMTEDEQLLSVIEAARNAPIPMQSLWGMDQAAYTNDGFFLTWDQNTLLVNDEQRFLVYTPQTFDREFDYKRNEYYRFVANLNNQNHFLIGVSVVVLVLFLALGYQSRKQMHRRFLKKQANLRR